MRTSIFHCLLLTVKLLTVLLGTYPSFGQSGFDSLFIFSSENKLLATETCEQILESKQKEKARLQHWKKHKPMYALYKPYAQNTYTLYVKTAALSDSISKEIEVINQRYLVVYKGPYQCVVDMQKNNISACIYQDFKLDESVLIGKAVHQYKIVYPNKQSKWITFYADKIKPLNSQLIAFKIKDKWGVYHIEKNSFIAPNIYDDIQLLTDSTLRCVYKNKIGVINTRGRYITPTQWDVLTKLHTNLWIVGIQVHGKMQYGILNHNGEIIHKVAFDAIECESENSPYIKVKLNGKWGIYSLEGKEIILPYFDQISPIMHGVAVAKKGAMYGILDEKGKWIHYPQYQQIVLASDLYWILYEGEKIQLFDVKKRKSVIIDYSYVSYAGLDVFIVKNLANKLGLLSIDGKQVLPTKFDKLWIEPELETIVTSIKNYYSLYYLNGNLKVFMNYPFSVLEPYKNGLSKVIQKNKCGFINKDGLLVVSTQYDSVRNFVHGKAAVCINAKWGFVDENENFLVSPNYEQVGDFIYPTITWYKSQGKIGFLDNSGKEIIKPTFDSIVACNQKVYLVKENNKWGIVDKTGKIIAYPAYNYLYCLQSGYFQYRLYNKYGILDQEGKPVEADVYDEVIQEGIFLFLKKNQQWQPIQWQ